MKKILANLSVRQRISIGVMAALVMGGLWALVRWHRESDFKPLFTGVSAEDAAGIVQKLKESGTDYRLPDGGGAVLVPSARVAELRLEMAAAGLPKTGRMGFELFDKPNLGATEFSEHINYRRALEGELERSVMSLAEVESARVHVTFPKDSVFLESQQPAKASVLVKLRPGAHLAPANVQAIDNLVASAVEGLSPDAVSVLDMNGNLLGRPKAAGGLDGPEGSEASLEFRHKVETDLVTKINSTLEPLLGANKFKAGASVECDFSGGEQSEEIFDPSHSVMASSQRSEDTSGYTGTSGVPGTASNLPQPTSRPAAGRGTRSSRVSESITYQTSRTVKKTRLPAGTVRRMSVTVLVDQDLNWQKTKTGYQRVLVPPSPEKLKIIRDLVAGVTGFSAERGDNLVIETLPFESTLSIEPPASPAAPAVPPNASPLEIVAKWDRKTQMIAAAAGAGLLVLLVVIGLLLRAKGARNRKRAEDTSPPALPAGSSAAVAAAIEGDGADYEARLAEQQAEQKRLETQTLAQLKLAPTITKAAEVLAKHLREKISKDPEISAQILRTWIREDES
jgi:flagellar M-ring protein FliF